MEDFSAPVLCDLEDIGSEVVLRKRTIGKLELYLFAEIKYARDDDKPDLTSFIVGQCLIGEKHPYYQVGLDNYLLAVEEFTDREGLARMTTGVDVRKEQQAELDAEVAPEQ